jgi:hypothetical protein
MLQLFHLEEDESHQRITPAYCLVPLHDPCDHSLIHCYHRKHHTCSRPIGNSRILFESTLLTLFHSRLDVLENAAILHVNKEFIDSCCCLLLFATQSIYI